MTSKLGLKLLGKIPFVTFVEGGMVIAAVGGIDGEVPGHLEVCLDVVVPFLYFCQRGLSGGGGG